MREPKTTNCMRKKAIAKNNIASINNKIAQYKTDIEKIENNYKSQQKFFKNPIIKYTSMEVYAEVTNQKNADIKSIQKLIKKETDKQLYLKK